MVPLQFPTFRESFPPLSGSPGVLDSATALGIIKALLQNIWHRSTSCHILQAMHLGNDRSGNVCQFSTASSNGSSILLPKWPAFTLRLYVILFVPVRVKLTVIQLTNSTHEDQGTGIIQDQRVWHSLFSPTSVWAGRLSFFICFVRFFVRFLWPAVKWWWLYFYHVIHSFCLCCAKKDAKFLTLNSKISRTDLNEKI